MGCVGGCAGGVDLGKLVWISGAREDQVNVVESDLGNCLVWVGDVSGRKGGEGEERDKGRGGRGEEWNRFVGFVLLFLLAEIEGACVYRI